MKFYEVATAYAGNITRGGIKTNKATAERWAAKNRELGWDCFVVEADEDAITLTEYYEECKNA